MIRKKSKIILNKIIGKVRELLRSKASKLRIILNKEVGETPLFVLEKFKRKNKFYGNKKLTYAGRLDPMAEGKLLVLVGKNCNKKEKYLDLDKEYEFEILMDFKSDTQDILGISEFNLNNGEITVCDPSNHTNKSFWKQNLSIFVKVQRL